MVELSAVEHDRRAEIATDIRNLSRHLDDLMLEAATREKDDWAAMQGYSSSLTALVQRYKSVPVTQPSLVALNFELDSLLRDYHEITAQERFQIHEDESPGGTLREYIQNVQAAANYLESRMEAIALDDVELPPEQTTAPFQFQITASIVTILDQTNHPKENSAGIAEAARSTLVEMSDDLLADLAKSNHPRILRAFEQLRGSIVERASVVETGMRGTAFQAQVTASSDEIADSLLILLTEFARGALNYAAQFEDWQRFSDNAAESTMFPDAVEGFVQVANNIADSLEGRPEVDERVVVALRSAVDWNEKAPSPRSRLSLARIVSNFAVTCYNVIVKNPAKILADMASTAVVIIVLDFALRRYGAFLHTADGMWLVPVADYIRRRLAELK